MRHLELNNRQITHIKKHMPALHLYLAAYADTEFDSRAGRRTGYGSALEIFYHSVLAERYAAPKIEFDALKAEQQLHNGPDGIPDNGYDLKLKWLDMEYRIDSKWQECLRYGRVSLALYYNSGIEQFALSGKCTHSVHFHMEYNPVSKVRRVLLERAGKPVPPEYVMRIVIVDLEKFRSLRRCDNGIISVGPYTEYRGNRTNDRLIDIDAKWLVEQGCALNYTIEC